MNLKFVALTALIAGLVLVPLVAAAPLLAQQKTQDQLQTKDQDCLQTKDYTCNGTGEQTQLRTCNQQQLQTRNCTTTSACNGNCTGNTVQNRTRLCECNGNENAVGSLKMEQYNYQRRCRNQN